MTINLSINQSWIYIAHKRKASNAQVISGANISMWVIRVKVGNFEHLI